MICESNDRKREKGKNYYVSMEKCLYNVVWTGAHGRKSEWSHTYELDKYRVKKEMKNGTNITEITLERQCDVI